MLFELLSDPPKHCSYVQSKQQHQVQQHPFLKMSSCGQLLQGHTQQKPNKKQKEFPCHNY
jgi:hypothetical protein